MNPSSSSSKRKRNTIPSHSDDSQFTKYDVFVNYSSEDIGKSFISHLLGALRRNGFAILDHHACSQFFKALEQSEIYVLVFSIGYASSVACLDELVHIMDCFRKFDGRKVLPIFFNVLPSEVRNQKGSFEKAFEAHKINVDPVRLQKWRQALKDGGQLAGLHVQNGDEEKFVREIVEELENMQNPQELHVTDYPVGIESRVQELISNLRLDLNTVSIVSVLGISGIGKTTIVKAMYNRIASKFDACCFLDIHNHLKTPNWKVELQKKLISYLSQSQKFPIISNHDDGVTKIRKLVSRQKVLLVLDDVGEFQQLQALGIQPARFCPGSRIIVTTRDKRSLGILPHAPYNIRTLNRRDALQLFTRLTFEHDEDAFDKKLVQDIVRCASGLPLVLEVWSREFKHHDRELWPMVLETLKRIPHGDVQKQLQISYDSLDKRGKKLFLDIACFFYGMHKDLVVKVLQDEVLTFFPDIHLRYLVDKGLVKMGFGTELLMINAIREMGQEIVRQESEDEPGQRTRLRDRRDVLYVLTECSGTDSVESIRLDFEKEEEVTSVQIEAFRKMSNLRMIQLLDPYLSWTVSSTDDMPAFSFKKLKYLEWYGFPLKHINIDMSNVEVVLLENSKLEILWEGMKNLKKLRILDVRSSNSLTKTGKFYGLENLEEMRFHGCGNLTELDSSLECLEKLAKLYLNNCTRLKRFPWDTIVRLRSLRDINLSHCPDIGLERDEVITPFISSLKACHITRLQLAGCNIFNISSEIGNLTWLKHLNLSDNQFPTLPHTLSQLHELNTIDLSCCANMSSIPNLPPKLTSLRAPNCKNLTNLPSNMSEFKGLREVWLSGCSKLGLEDPKCLIKVAQLRDLRDLKMANCNVSQVPNEFGNLGSLQILDLSGNTFSSLPDSFLYLSRLVNLKINDCSLLQWLPPLPSNLTWIEASRCWLLDVMSFDSMISSYISRCPSNILHASEHAQVPQPYKNSPSISRLCISLSWDEVPNWCSYGGGGRMLSFMAPVHLDKKISGIILCAAIRFNLPYLGNLGVKLVNKTKEASYCVAQGVDPHCSMFAKFYELDDETLVVEAGDIVVLGFLGKHAPKRILGCAIRLMYEGGDVVDPIPSEMTTGVAHLNDISSGSDDDDDVCSFPLVDDEWF